MQKTKDKHSLNDKRAKSSLFSDYQKEEKIIIKKFVIKIIWYQLNSSTLRKYKVSDKLFTRWEWSKKLVFEWNQALWW